MVPFTCGACENEVESEIEEILSETKRSMRLTSFCPQCGQLNIVPVSKNRFPHQVHDEAILSHSV